MARKENKAARFETAAQACEERLRDIEALLDQIGQEVSAIRKEYSAGDGFNWGFAGDLGRWRECLIEGMTAITSFSREEVEETLAEIRDLANGGK